MKYPAKSSTPACGLFLQAGRLVRRFFSGALGVAAGVGATTAGGASRFVPANDAAFVYEGRVAIGAGGSVHMAFPGVTAHLRFRGDSLNVQVEAPKPLYFDVSVDGGAFVELAVGPGAGFYPLVRGVGASAHTVALVRRNESWQGVCTIRGFMLGDGAQVLPPPDLPVRKLMFIGDSVTCGELTDFQPGRDFHDPANSDARLSYGMILARRLSAQCHLVSYGGRGIFRDWQGNRATGNASQFYERALPDEPGVPWDHARYVPDAIGIQLGTNDFSPGIPAEGDFVGAYLSFIRKVRADAPKALIFLMESPMLADNSARGPRRSVLRAYLEQIVARSADSRVILAPLSHAAGVPGNEHPSGREHEAMADELEPLLRRALGW